MPLTFRLHTESAIPLEVDALQLETLCRQSSADIARTSIVRGNQQLPCGEFFHVFGSAADDMTVVWQGDCHNVKWIGASLSRGTVRVEGHAGMHLGAEMTGGEILVQGNVADWLGAEMHGGRIYVRGDAGHLVGAAYRGGRRGMTGGEILIEGNAGNEIGQTMRRGLIAVAGCSGDVAGGGMIAGTILLFGSSGRRHGTGMKRGTLGLFDLQNVPEILPTFKYASTYRPVFLEHYFRHLRERKFPVPETCFTARFDRYCGDLLELGKGEILKMQDG